MFAHMQIVTTRSAGAVGHSVVVGEIGSASMAIAIEKEKISEH